MLASIVQEIFLRSSSDSGLVFFGLTVTNSFFHQVGHMKEEEDISLYMLVNGRAKKSANQVTRAGKTSPGTIDFGLQKDLILRATLYLQCPWQGSDRG